MSLKARDVREVLSDIETAPASSKPDSYKILQEQIFSSSDPDSLSTNISQYVESLLGDSLGILQSRPILVSVVSDFSKIPSAEVKIDAGKQILDLLAPRVASFEEQDLEIKRIVADALTEEDDFAGAAKVLQTINLDGSTAFSANARAAHWIRIVRCYLEEDQAENAVAFINRIKNVLPDVTDRETRLTFLLCQARILDSQRSFLEAANRYYDVSTETAVAEEERLRSLSQAITCAVLAPAGPQRATTLAKLYKDDRAKQMEEYGIMEKIFLNRLLSPGEVEAFAEKLATHQKAKTADGSTVLHKAVLEHNLLAASRLYRNIYTAQLGKLLSVDADTAERYAAQMIEQGRLVGSIDQIQQLIFFDGQGSRERTLSNGAAIVGHEQRRWDSNVQRLAERVEKIASMIEDQNPVSQFDQLFHSLALIWI
jgi:COP9 signalosome complex subunit 4